MDATLHGMQEAHLHLQERFISLAAQQTLSLHDKWLRPILRNGVGPRIDPAKGESLPVLLCRGPVRVEYVALVEHRIDNLIQQGLFHDSTSSASNSGSNRLMVCSQVSNP